MSTFSYIGRSDWNRLPLSHAAWTAGMQALYHRACLLELWESTRVKNRPLQRCRRRRCLETAVR